MENHTSCCQKIHLPWKKLECFEEGATYVFLIMDFFVCSSLLDLSCPVKTPKPENLRKKKTNAKLKTNKAHN